MLMQDLRYAMRLLVSRPAFTAIAVLTLALGIGANATILSWTESLILRPLPGVVNVDRLVDVNGTDGPRADLSMSYPDFVDLREQLPPGVADVVCGMLFPMVLRVGDRPERVWGRVVSGNYFDVLGVKASQGRTFRPDEDGTQDTDPVVVLGHRLWQRRFESRADVVGRTVMLNERAFTVVGVAPEGFLGSDVGLASEVFVPMAMLPTVGPGELLRSRGDHAMKVQARLVPGALVAQVQAGIDVVARRLAAAYPATNRRRGMAVYLLWRAPGELSAIIAPVFAVLVAMAGVVLLVACANVASLLLVRVASRQREVAVRLALGASRGQVVRQFLTESTLLALLGGAAGLAVAQWTSNLLSAFLPPTPYPLFVHTGLSPRIFLATFAVAAVTGVVFGLAPALQASRPDLVPALKDTGSGLRRRAWLRRGMVVAQVAFSLLMLVMAGLFLRTLDYARTADPGFNMRRGILASIDLKPAGYDEPRGLTFYRDLLTRLRNVPGIRAASLAASVPLNFSSSDMSPQIEGYARAKDEDVTIYFNTVAPGYFDTMEIPLLKGRAIDDRDTRGAPGALVINETMARRYWKGRDPIGGRVRIGKEWFAVVGVAKDGKYELWTEAQRPFMYIPLYQSFDSLMTLHVRTDGDPSPLVASIQRELRAVDPRLPVFDVRTMDEHLQVGLFMMRMAAILLGIFGAVALLLATTGLYGVLAQVVAQRTREVGIRMALGANRADVLRLVMGHGLTTTVVGVGLGLALAAGATRLVASQLIGVGPFDPVAFTGAATLLVAATLVASLLPARRAASQDPLKALRHE